MGEHAKFNATLAKVTVNGKKAQVLLEMQHKDLEKHYLTLVSSIDEQIIVQLGNPQMSIEECGVDIDNRQPGAKVTIVEWNVEKIEPAGGEQDELAWSDEEQQEPEEEGTDDASEGAESNPEGEDEQTEVEGDEEPQGGTDELSGAKDEKEELEEFILERRPHFEDIPYDFPSLLQRRQSGESWLEISSSLGVTKGQLSTKWSAYKKRVKDLLA